MPDDMNDFMKSPYQSLDALRLGASISSAVGLARTDPLGGLTTVISTSAVMRDLVSPTSRLFADHPLTVMEPAAAFSTLGTLRSPYEALTGMAIADPFRGTMSSLASVAGVAGSFQKMLGNVSQPAPFVSSQFPTSTALFGASFPDGLTAARTVASPYLASAASVFALESSFASIAASARLPGSTLVATSLPGISAANRNYLQNGVASLSIAALKTWDRFNSDTALFSTAPFASLRAPALELYATAQVAGAVTLSQEAALPSDPELEAALAEVASSFEARLASLDVELVEVYRGGVNAIEVGGPDWQRHSMGSFRELINHVVHNLSPDDQIVPSARPSDLHDGRPTRAARLNFIFADIAGPEIAPFYQADMKAALSLIELLNGGTHKLGNKATPQQLHYLRGRVEGLVASILAAGGR